MLSAILTITAALSTATAGGPSEISYEVGTFGSPDANWELFDDQEFVPTMGLRYGHHLTEHVSLLVGWQHGQRGSRVSSYGYNDDYGYDYGYDDEYDYEQSSEFHSKFVTNQILVGPKYHYDLTKWLTPYGTVQLMGWYGRMLFDDDIYSDDNPNQLRYSALAPGGIAALGVDVKPIRVRGTARIATHLEMGYGQTLKLKFKDDKGATTEGSPVDVGELAFKGFYMHWGIGLRF